MRRATRGAHLRLESSIDLDTWDRSQHQWWLGRLLGLHEPLEAQLNYWCAPRRRAQAFEADLFALGLSTADVEALPRRPPSSSLSDLSKSSLPDRSNLSPSGLPLPPPSGLSPFGLPEVLGQLYVLDGSALGGAVIAGRAIANGVPVAACGSLLMHTESARYWRETRSLIDALPPTDADRAAGAAVALFDVFESWLTADESPRSQERSFDGVQRSA